MLVVDELKKNDPQLRLVALMLAGGLFVLLTGLWWVQVVSAKEYQSHLNTQAYRTIRIPAVRGKILDCEGRVLAENRPTYNLCLYFDDLSDRFKAEYKRIQPVNITTNRAPFWKFWNRAPVITTTRVKLKPAQVDALNWQARYNVASQIAAKVGQQLGQPLTIDFKKFARSYQAERAMPFIILPDLNDAQIARFEENYQPSLGANLQMQSTRVYPLSTTAAHLLGELKQDNSSINGEESDYNYRLPDYRGITGVENIYDAQLHGHAGVESAQVNSQGYRQSVDIGNPPEAGQNITLTIDLDIQRAAEKAIIDRQGAGAHAAVVVMEVHSGNIIAMASSPAFDPNDFAQGISTEKYTQLQQSTGEKNRATYENYAPGSIFKTVVGLAALENGLNPNERYYVQPNPSDPLHGCIFVGRRKVKDTAPPGEYDFQNAFIHSSNAYFITNGLRTGIESIIRMGKKFHLGERTGIFPNQEAEGDFPTLDDVTSDNWRAGDTANVSIGQGKVSVTPIQMAVMISAIANGGTVLWPRLVDRIEPQDATTGMMTKQLPSGLVRDTLNVHQRNLQIVRAAMLQDVENPEGSGTFAAVPGLQICAKTGTAQVQDEHNHNTGHNYWFASFAPYQNPKYTVIVMVESAVESGSGGKTSGPIAHDVYEAILQKYQGKLALKK
ncbi:MAG TPA: penicillin-binding transpeptidase domain-containing protein [Verrucomicrobiae bacterium]|jgi:penicillin-binding protein 2